MKNVFIFVVILISVHIVTAFSIANKLSIENFENLTTTPVVKLSDNESESESIANIVKNSHNLNDSVALLFTTNDDLTDITFGSGINERPEPHLGAVISSGGHVPSIILKQRRPQKRSFFGFIIIPCK